jgi:hypothetical protein
MSTGSTNERSHDGEERRAQMLLDQKIAERYAAQAVLAVGDRIENRGISERKWKSY